MNQSTNHHIQSIVSAMIPDLAKQADSFDRMSKARRYMVASRTHEAISSMVTSMLDGIPSELVPAEFKTEVGNLFILNLPAIEDKALLKIYETYTEEELDFALSFFESEKGQSIMNKAFAMSPFLQAEGQAWAQALQPQIQAIALKHSLE